MFPTAFKLILATNYFIVILKGKFTLKKILSILLSASIGLLFIFSAASKIYPMEPFEFQFVDLGVASWNTAPYFARILIGLEFFIGMMLILNIALRKFTLKFAMFLLVIFSIYLVFKISTDGNSGNCGCFGIAVKMTPLQGILKNLILLLSCIVVFVLKEPEYWKSKWKRILIPVLFISSFLLGFFIYPVHLNFSSRLSKSAVNYQIPLELLYEETVEDKPAIDLRKGKHVIAFLSMSCMHCRIAASKMQIMKKKNPAIPFYFIINGDKERLTEFLEDTQVKTIPYSIFLGPEKWMQMAGVTLPVIMLVENSEVKKKFNGMDLNQTAIENWMKK